MANISESSIFEAGIYRLETTDPVLGGTDTAPANEPHRALANRTRYLKDRLDAAGVEVAKGEATNVNNITATGFHYVLNSAANRPPGQLDGYVLVPGNTPTQFAQIWISRDNNNMFLRRAVAGPTFTDWVKIAVSGTTDLTFTVNSFLNSWVAAPSSAIVFERIGNQVFISGRAQGGQTNLPLFSVTPDLWPSEARQMVVASNNGSLWTFTILPDGSTSVSDGGSQQAFPGVLNFSVSYRL